MSMSEFFFQHIIYVCIYDKKEAFHEYILPGKPVILDSSVSLTTKLPTNMCIEEFEIGRHSEESLAARFIH